MKKQWLYMQDTQSIKIQPLKKQYFTKMAFYSALFLIVLSAISNAQAKNPKHSPRGYMAICDYGEPCTVAQPSLVAFGHNSQFVFKILNGNFVCSESTFNRANFVNKSNASSQPHCSITLKPTEQDNDSVASSSPLTDGVYAIVSRYSKQALSIAPAGQLQQTPYTADASQHFIITQRNDGYFSVGTLAKSDKTLQKALEVKDWQTEDGAQVALNKVADSWSQHWEIKYTDAQYVAITSRFNGKALDLLELSTGAPIRLWTYWGGDNQQWQLIPAEPVSTHQPHILNQPSAAFDQPKTSQ